MVENTHSNFFVKTLLAKETFVIFFKKKRPKKNKWPTMAQPCGEGKLALSHWHSQEKREIGELRPDGQLFFGEPPG